jgi:hypothetical protein
LFIHARGGRHIEAHAEKFGRRFVLEIVSVHGGMWALQCKVPFLASFPNPKPLITF